jgi:lysyl-tRNA synthetase class 2
MTPSMPGTRTRPAWVPPLAAALAAIVGLVNLASALTPNISWRGHLLLGLEPVEAIPVFHALTVPAGVALCVAALYLGWRRRRAWRAALGLVLVLGALNLLKGLDVEEALACWALAGLLWWGRGAFTVAHDPVTLRSVLWRVPLLIAGAVLLAAAAAIAGDAHVGAGALGREIGDLLLWQPGPVHFREALEWVPASVGIVSAGVALACAYIVFRPLAAPRALPDRGARGLARQLVRAHGVDTLSFFKLREDKHYLFSADRRAFVGYRVEAGVMLLSGDPVGPEDAIGDLVREVLAFAEVRGLKVGGVGASEAMAARWEDAGLRTIYLGDEALVDTGAFSLEGRPIRKVRQSVTRLQKAGYVAEAHRLSALPPAELAEIEGLVERGRDGQPERGFSMAMDHMRGAHQEETFVVCARDGEGRLRGVLHFVPCYRRPTMSLSFMRRERDTPNGLTEFLVVRAIELFREQGIEQLSLNFAPFARWLHSPERLHEHVLGRLIARFNRFFQIESLYRWGAKFFPRWEPRYLVFQGLALPRTGLAAMWAEGQLPKLRLPARASG